MTVRRLIIALSLVLCASSLSWAQTTQPDPWEQQRFRLGALAFTPTIQIKNVGVDTNVFNTVDDPKKDFTFTAGPQVDWWLRAGAVRLHGTNGADAVYFNEYKSERSVNQSHKLTLEYRLNRIRPYVSGSYLDTKDRPGYEIDARARHTETDFRGGAIIRLTAKTRIDLAGFQRQYEFTGDDEFQGTNLAAILNRKTTGGSGTLLFSLTPLTTLTLLSEFGEESFAGEPVRNNSSFRIMPGVELSPDALLKGTARMGYRKLNMTSPTIPDFEGVVASANISYVLLGRTRLTVAVDRDVQFSYDVSRPYYVLTGIGGAIRQSLARGFDLEARGTERRLSYQRATDASTSVADRLDKVTTLGGGIGYTASGGTRIALNADYFRRRSPVYGSDYNGLRAGVAVTYSF
jgi:hypothetical protein